MVKMTYELQSGDICEVQTRKNAEPTRQWLEAAKTARARSKIKSTLRAKGVDI